MIDLIVDLTRDPETNMLRLRRLLRPFIFIQVKNGFKNPQAFSESQSIFSPLQ